MAKIKIKIEKKRKILPKEEIQEVEHESTPSMTDVKKESKAKTLVPSPPKVVHLEESKKKFQKKSLFFTLFIIVISLLVLGLIIWFGFLARKDKIAGMIPEEAVLYVWVDINKKWDPSLKDILTREIEELVQPYHLDFKKDILPILGNQSALALLPSIGDQLSPVLIFESNKREGFKDVLSQIEGDLKKEIYKEYEMECMDGEDLEECFAVFDNFFILARNPESLQKIIDAQEGTIPSLKESSNFKSTLAKLPRGTPSLIYLRPEYLPSIVSGFSENQNYISGLLTFLGIQEAKNFALVVFQNTRGLNFEGVLDISFGKNFTSELINLVPQNVVSLISGYNLGQTYLDLKNKLADQSPLYSSLISSLEKTLKEDYNLDLEKDIISWMNREYEIIVMPRQDGLWPVACVFEFDDLDLVKEKLELVEKVITSYLAKTYPKEKEIILEDGTKAIELLPDIESYQFSDIQYEDVNIRTISNIDPSFSYAFLDNKLVAANHFMPVKSIISAIKFKEKRLVNQEDFKISYSKISQQNNGILYINIEKLSDFLGLEELSSSFKNFIGTQINSKLKGYLLFR